MQEKQDICFIIGIGRSGTTLLTRLLNNHPALHAMPEANFIQFFLFKYGGQTDFTEKDIDIILEQIAVYKKAHPIIGWTFDAAEARKHAVEFVSNNPQAGFRELSKLIYKHFKVVDANKESATVLIDKNPSTTLYLSGINRIFPNARYIYLVRDYRANVLSRKQKVYMKTPNVTFNAYRWVWFNKRAIPFWKANSGRVLFVKYEDLITNTHAELNRICKFLEVKNDLDLTKALNQYSPHNELPEVAPELQTYFEKKYTDLSRPVNTERLDSWKQELPSNEIELLDSICLPFAGQFGYLPHHKLPVAKTFFLKISTLHYRIAVFAYMNKEILVNHLWPRIKIRRLRQIFRKHGFK